MTLQECYQRLGGDYDKVLRRLRKESMVSRFLLKFPKDDSFARLESAMAAGDADQAFQAAHTLRGVSANLQLDALSQVSGELTEVLRAQNLEQAAALLPGVQQQYLHTLETIRAFQCQR